MCNKIRDIIMEAKSELEALQERYRRSTTNIMDVAMGKLNSLEDEEHEELGKEMEKEGANGSLGDLDHEDGCECLKDKPEE